jgi:hypothetical protein
MSLAIAAKNTDGVLARDAHGSRVQLPRTHGDFDLR